MLMLMVILYLLNRQNVGENFKCPSCEERLFLRCGKKNVAHFAHKPDMQECSCDRITHQIAIDLLCEHVFDCDNDEVKQLGGYGNNCQREYPVDKYKADIGVLSDNGGISKVIEVCHTHETEEQKWKYFNDNKIPCIEVDAQSVIDAHNGDQQHIKILFHNIDQIAEKPIKRRILALRKRGPFGRGRLIRLK